MVIKLVNILLNVIIWSFLVIFVFSAFASASICDSGDLNSTCVVHNDVSLDHNISGCGNLIIRENSELRIYGRVTINCKNLTIENGSSINGSGHGYGPDEGPGQGNYVSASFTGDDYYGCGAGHGARGQGGYVSQDCEGGDIYGFYRIPYTMGSGGGYVTEVDSGEKTFGPAYGGDGGAAIKINASGTLNISGTIAVDGEKGHEVFYYFYSDLIGDTTGYLYGGGGAGGSIWIITEELVGGGAVFSRGGKGGYYLHGWGAGGRVAIYTDNNLFEGQYDVEGGYHSDGSCGTLHFSKLPNGPVNLSVNESTAPPNKWLDLYKYWPVDDLLGNTFERIDMVDDFDDENYGSWNFMNVNTITEANSSISFQSTSNDPYMKKSDYITIDDNHYGDDFLRVRMKIEGGGTGTAKIYWDNGNGFPTEQCSKSFEVKLDGKWHTYLLVLGMAL